MDTNARRLPWCQASAMVVLLVVLVYGSVGAHAATPRHHIMPPDFAQIDAYIAHTMHERQVPGVALAITRGKQIVHLQGFGKADNQGRPVTPQTPFRIGSVTKSFTALAIMQLVEQGKIDLQAPVLRYLPWFVLADPPASARITVAHLLYQTGGIPSDALAPALADPTLSLAQYGRNVRAVQPRPAGQSFAYANANYNLLGLIVEAVAGQDYASYVQEHILAPLDMHHSFATPTSQGRGDLAVGYRWAFGVPRPTPDRYIPSHLPAGFLSASVEDLGHYLIAQMNSGYFEGARMLSPGGIAALHTPGRNADIPATPGAASTGGGYAMGWVNGSIYGVRAIWHNGDDARFNALVAMTDTGWGIALLTNASSALTEQEPANAIFGGAVRLLDGQLPVPTGQTSVGTTYLVLNSVLVACSVGIGGSLLRLPQWYRLRRNGSMRHRGLLLRALMRVAAEVLVSVGILIAVPVLIGSWQLFLFGVDDLAWWLLIAATTVLLMGVLRGVLLARLLAWRRT